MLIRTNGQQNQGPPNSVTVPPSTPSDTVAVPLSLSSVADAVSAFSFDALTHTQGNAVVSGMSLELALMMTLLGATGETR
ncbi:hypothetical protein KIPB_008145 [Kipferlia bialata]|uniref:Serpin domain-containing protein n=1 Tax=Kipferlia bialata TaxID=797122 RepID=A0A391NXF0_9EUKA|nr:hypothetical protein KIPB_008145 [Kipferlia bialata]|eukprot:g8145.t1